MESKINFFFCYSATNHVWGYLLLLYLDFMLRRFLRGFGILLKAEALMWIIFLILAGIAALINN